MKIIEGHAHACGMLLNTNEVLNYMNANNIDKIVLTAGEPNSQKVYKLPYFAKAFTGSKLIYANNALTAMIIGISKMNRHIDQGNEKVALMTQECPEYKMNTFTDELIQVYTFLTARYIYKVENMLINKKIHVCGKVWYNGNTEKTRVTGCSVLQAVGD